MPNMLPVRSSMIRAVGYDGKDLFVEFNDKSIYQYSDVPPNQVCAVAFADSVGRAFLGIVKDRYPYQKIDRSEEEVSA